MAEPPVRKCFGTRIVLTLLEGSLENYGFSLDFALLESPRSNGLFRSLYCHKTDQWLGEHFRYLNPQRKQKLTRRQGDALYFLIKHLDVLKKKGHSAAIKSSWESALLRQVKCLLDIWNRESLLR